MDGRCGVWKPPGRMNQGGVLLEGISSYHTSLRRWADNVARALAQAGEGAGAATPPLTRPCHSHVQPP